MHAQCTTSTLGQHRKITTRLCCFHNPEPVLLSGHRHIVRVITGDLEKDAGVWSAFVSLPGRMQKARPKAKTGRDVFVITDKKPRQLQSLFVRVVHLDISQQREVIARSQAVKMCFQIAAW